MKRIYFIMLLFPFVSCGQVNNEFKLQETFPVDMKKPVCITANDCFCFSSDSNLFYLFLHYSDSKCDLADTVEFSPYKSKIHFFKSKKNNSHIVFWETEYEYYPIIHAYYVIDGSIVKIGELEISLPCKNCESFEYPIKDIRVMQEKKEIEISFLEDVNLWDKESNEWKSYQAGDFKYKFSIEKTN